MTQPTPAAVTATALTARYGSVTALRGVSIAVPASRITALVGPNGSGKSTLLNVLAGVHRPAGGRLDRSHRDRPALVVQRSDVSDTLPITVRQTVAMGRWAHRASWRRLTKRDKAIVEECLDRLEIGDLADRPLGALSGGQRQRALLAQGLAQQSDLLLLDEPGTGLDAATHERVIGLLRELSGQGVTVVHATHAAELADRADHRIELALGRITRPAPPGGAVPRLWLRCRQSGYTCWRTSVTPGRSPCPKGRT